MKHIGLFLAALALASGLGAQEVRVTLQNREPAADFYYVVVDQDPVEIPAAKDWVQRLAKEKPSLEKLSSQDFGTLFLRPGQGLLGGFVETGSAFDYKTLLRWGFLFASEAVGGRTIFLTRANFEKFNERRLLELTTLEFGIPAPARVIDGRFADWEGQKVDVSFGADFIPPGSSRESEGKLQALPPAGLSEGLGRIKSLQFERGADRLFLKISQWDQWTPGKSLMFYLFRDRSKREENSLSWEIPVNHETGAVYLWSRGNNYPVKAGFYARSGPDLEAEILLNKLPAEVKADLFRFSVDFSQFLGQNESYVEFYYSTISLEILKR